MFAITSKQSEGCQQSNRWSGRKVDTSQEEGMFSIQHSIFGTSSFESKLEFITGSNTWKREGSNTWQEIQPRPEIYRDTGLNSYNVDNIHIIEKIS